MREPGEGPDAYVLSVIGLFGLIIFAIIVIVILVRGTGDEEAPPVVERPAATTLASSPASPGAAPAVEISMVPTLMFDQSELTVSQGEVTVRANNVDDATTHNFALYESRGAAEAGEDAIAATELCAAECVEELTFETPPPGTYFFRCDVHPTLMTGAFIVQ